jgi:DNA-binding response OmpR family regulator
MNTNKILIVDDDSTIRRFLSTLLSDRGYEVHEAEDGEQGIRLAGSIRPDLMLLDLIMPYRDGFEVLHDLKEDRGTARIPIIIMSVKNREDEIVKGLNMGADDYVVKPFNALELVVRVRKLLEKA